ncbi:MAG TPA: protease modulator HflC [Pirellulales bacterium]|nr:protease modulator HflC [Pirellulales bacterium]
MTSHRFSIIRSRIARYIVRWAVVAAVIMVVALQAAFFTVQEGQAVVVTRLGRPTRDITEPGAYWKIPAPIEQSQRIDVRRQLLTTPQVATLTRDKKNVVLTTFVVWHVAEPLKFLQSVGTMDLAAMNLTSMVVAAKNQQLGQTDLSALVSLDRQQIKLDTIEAEVLRSMHEAALQKMGIAVDQVGFERVALPKENMTAVFDRMRAERHAEANRIRSEGAKQARAIRDEAHVKSQEILRRGREEAGRVFAEAEREAGTIVASAHQQNPAFFQFWSALQAAKQSLKERSTLVLSSDQLFFDTLTKPPALVPRDVPRERSETVATPSLSSPSSTP